MEIRLADGRVVTENEFREMHPNVSFPAVLGADILADFGGDAVLSAPAPTVTDTQIAYRDGVEQDRLGNWVYKWAMRDLTAGEIEARKPTEAQYTAALEAMYDATAQSRRYDNRLTCALRAGYAGPFQAEGTAFAIWMDSCNANAYGIMGQVLAGQIPQPTIPELLAMMPPMVWPA